MGEAVAGMDMTGSNSGWVQSLHNERPLCSFLCTNKSINNGAVQMDLMCVIWVT